MNARPDFNNDEQLSAYLDGELSPAQREEMDRRLQEEPGLQSALAELKSLSGLFQQLPDNSLANDFSKKVMHAAEKQMLLGTAPDEPTTVGTASTDKKVKTARDYWWVPALLAATLAGVLIVPGLFRKTGDMAKVDSAEGAATEEAVATPASSDELRQSQSANLREAIASAPSRDAEASDATMDADDMPEPSSILARSAPEVDVPAAPMLDDDALDSFQAAAESLSATDAIVASPELDGANAGSGFGGRSADLDVPADAAYFVEVQFPPSQFDQRIVVQNALQIKSAQNVSKELDDNGEFFLVEGTLEELGDLLAQLEDSGSSNRLIEPPPPVVKQLQELLFKNKQAPLADGGDKLAKQEPAEPIQNSFLEELDPGNLNFNALGTATASQVSQIHRNQAPIAENEALQRKRDARLPSDLQRAAESRAQRDQARDNSAPAGRVWRQNQNPNQSQLILWLRQADTQ